VGSCVYIRHMYTCGPSQSTVQPERLLGQKVPSADGRHYIATTTVTTGILQHI